MKQTVIHGSIIEQVIGPWASRSDYASEPRYQLARRDEPSMRNLIRAELLPTIGCWDSASRSRLRTALAVALQSEEWTAKSLESWYTPVAFPEFGEKRFWLWVWDELFREDLPSPEELEGFELDWSVSGNPDVRLAPGAVIGEWLQVFEERTEVRYRWDADD